MTRNVWLLLVLSGLWLPTTACRKGGTSTEAAELQQAFQASPAQPAEIKPEAASPAVTGSGQETEVKQIVHQATAAMRTNAYVEAAALLQVLKTQPNLTPEQRIAVQDASVAVLARVAEAADRGDPAAKRAVEAIKKMPRR